MGSRRNPVSGVDPRGARPRDDRIAGGIGQTPPWRRWPRLIDKSRIVVTCAKICGAVSVLSTKVSLRHPSRPSESRMFDRTYYATHPDMMECVSQRGTARPLPDPGPVPRGRVRAQLHPCRPLRDRRRRGRRGARCSCPTRPSRPRRPATRSSSGASWRSSMSARSRARSPSMARAFALGNKDCLYVTMGAKDVQFLRRRRALLPRLLPGAQGASRRASCRSPRPMRWSAAASRNRTSARSSSSSSRASATARSWSWA